MAKGTIKWTNFDRGFGLITPADGGRDVFVYVPARSRRLVKEGEPVHYEVAKRGGRLEAVNVRVISSGRSIRVNEEVRSSGAAGQSTGSSSPLSVAQLPLPASQGGRGDLDSGPLAAGPRARRAAGPNEVDHFQDAGEVLVVVLEMPSLADRADLAEGVFYVDVFVSDGDGGEAPLRLLASVDDFADTLGFEKASAGEIRRGSWWHRAERRVSSAISSDEVAQRLQKAERALELAVLGERQADVDVKMSQAAAAIMGEMREQERAVVRFGSLLGLKYSDGQGEIVVIKQLSHAEMRAMDHFGGLTARPETALELLALAVLELNTSVGELPS